MTSISKAPVASKKQITKNSTNALLTRIDDDSTPYVLTLLAVQVCVVSGIQSSTDTNNTSYDNAMSTRQNSPLLESFKTHGWVCIPNLLSRSELHVLQTECTALYARESVESIIAKGCVLDVLAQCPMRDSDAARTDANNYLKTRAKQLKSINDPHGVFASLLFTKLPTIARQLMTTEDVFFFNEHYVVKPPRSHVEFRWHRDDDEQLAMCLHRESIRPYVSAWCALDDVTRVNGALQFVSLDALPESEEKEDVENLKSHASEPVTAKQGDVLFFLSNVWHCSSSNGSETARRAFYAQYSGEKIRARPNDPSPLSFAVPWTVRNVNGGDFTKKFKR